ncbi:PRELI domain containing 1b [Tachysurus ichikawai]
MGKYYFSETDIRSTWEQVLSAFWQRYPNPYSTHVLTEDVIFREVTPDNVLLSRRLFTKTNRLPRWAELIFPGNLSRSVYIVEDSVVDPSNRHLTTLTWNLNHSKLMTVVERCVFHGEEETSVWTHLTREAWISSGVFGLSRPIQTGCLADSTISAPSVLWIESKWLLGGGKSMRNIRTEQRSKIFTLNERAAWGTQHLHKGPLNVWRIQKETTLHELTAL